MNLYHAKLHTYFHSPRHQGVIAERNIESKLLNPSCGDAVSYTGLIRNNYLEEIAFTGTGCVISQATASILAEFCKGRSVGSILQLQEDDIIRLIEMELGLLRLKCALLPLQAIKKALLLYQEKEAGNNVRSSESNACAQTD